MVCIGTALLLHCRRQQQYNLTSAYLTLTQRFSTLSALSFWVRWQSINNQIRSHDFKWVFLPSVQLQQSQRATAPLSRPFACLQWINLPERHRRAPTSSPSHDGTETRVPRPQAVSLVKSAAAHAFSAEFQRRAGGCHSLAGFFSPDQIIIQIEKFSFEPTNNAFPHKSETPLYLAARRHYCGSAQEKRGSSLA